MALSPSDNLITHKKVSSEVSPVNCGDWNANHDIKNLMGYILVEEKNLPAGTTTCTFDGLDGDVDEEYIIEGQITTANALNPEISMRINNDSGNNYIRTGFYQDDAQFNGEHITTSSFRLSIVPTTSITHQVFTAKILARTGFMRCIDLKSVGDNTSTTKRMSINLGKWTNTVDNITSITCLCSTTFSGTIRLWKRIPVEV